MIDYESTDERYENEINTLSVLAMMDQDDSDDLRCPVCDFRYMTLSGQPYCPTCDYEENW